MKAHKLASGRWRCQVYLGKADGKPIRESVTADLIKISLFLTDSAHENAHKKRATRRPPKIRKE